MAQVTFASNPDLDAKFQAWLDKQEINITKAEAARHFVKKGMEATEPWLSDVTADNPHVEDERQISLIEE